MKYYLFIFILCFTVSLAFSNSPNYNEDLWNSFSWIDKDYYIEGKEEVLFSILENNKENSKEESESISKTASPSYFSHFYIENSLKLNTILKNSSQFNWSGKFNSYINSSYYEAFLGFKNDEKVSINTQNSSLRFSPILMYYPANKLTPVLSFYIGSFKTPLIFNTLHNPIIYILRPTTQKHFFPALNEIKISKKAEHLGTAFEIALPFFNLHFFWKTHENCNSFNIYSAYRNDELLWKKYKINIAFVSSFFQENKNYIQTKKKISSKKNNYIRLYSISFIFDSPFFYFNSISAINVKDKKKNSIYSMSFRDEMSFRYKIASFNVGFSFQGRNYMRKQITSKPKKKDLFSFYLQEKFKYKIFSLYSSYHFFSDNSFKKIAHAYGIFYEFDSKYLQFKNELFVNKDVYNLKIALNIKPHLQYFSKMNIASFLYLQEKDINPNIIKKYEVASYIILPFSEIFRIKLLAGLSQETQKNKKILGKKKFFAYGETSFIFSQEKWKESLKIAFKYFSTKSCEISLKFRIEY